ncbi:S9 family peptidase [Spirosoma sp. 209]|uniref:alpha/beta hydrolase family protein n=1 Tax=Spirosoma sp. 209 TaxID=1955701 RepID=UPI00098D291E|nr:alpha/beta fold hydrolase [Spirosoma sp. 209]
MRIFHRLLVVLVSLRAGSAVAQTTEPIRYITTVPAGLSLTLEGTLSLPADTHKPVAVVLLIAGSGATDRDGNSPSQIAGLGTLKAATYRLLADSLVKEGIAVARYDKRGSGSNTLASSALIKPEDHRFDYYVQDAVGFIRQLQADKRFSRVYVAGHSEGSLVGMLAARATKPAGFISLAGAGRNIAEVLKTQLQQLPEPARELAYRDLDSLRAGQRVTAPEKSALMVLHPKLQPAMISWMQYDPALVLKDVPGTILIINGRHDLQVAVSEAEALKAARPDARLLLFDQMNHVLKDAPASGLEHLRTYTDPIYPLTPGLVAGIVRFIRP